MSRPSVALSVKYLPSDLRPFLLRRNGLKIVITAVVSFVCLFVVYVAASRYINVAVPREFRIAAVLYLLGIPLATILTNLVLLERVVKKTAGRDSVLLEISEAGVKTIEPHKTVSFEWKAYHRVVEDRDKFMFFAAGGGLLLPKRCFRSEEDLGAVSDFARKALNEAFSKV